MIVQQKKNIGNPKLKASAAIQLKDRHDSKNHEKLPLF